MQISVHTHAVGTRVCVGGGAYDGCCEESCHKYIAFADAEINIYKWCWGRSSPAQRESRQGV